MLTFNTKCSLLVYYNLLLKVASLLWDQLRYLSFSCLQSGRIWLPYEPSQAANVLPVRRPKAADNFVACRNLVLPPHCLVWQEGADCAEFVPLLVHHGLSFVVYDSQAIDHPRTRVLVDQDLAYAPSRVNLETLLLVL